MFDIRYKTEEEKLKAVRGFPYAIRYIYNPSEQVQLEAVMRNGTVIEYIYNPSENVQMAAVKENCHAIQFIHNPVPSVVRYMIENCDDLHMIQSMRIDFDELPDNLKLLLEVRF